MLPYNIPLADEYLQILFLGPDKEKLAKEVSAQLEFEKQKFLGSDKIEDDSAVLRRKEKENDDTKAIDDTKNMIAGSYLFLNFWPIDSCITESNENFISMTFNTIF